MPKADFPGLILPYRGRLPAISPDAFIAPNAVVIGDVVIGPETGVWFGCVVRGDMNEIRIGARTNIQDGTVIHVDSQTYGAFIGSDVTIGHMCLIHACTLEDGSFVGMHATVMDGAVVERGAMVAAGAVVTPEKRVPSGQLWGGDAGQVLARHQGAGPRDDGSHPARLRRARRARIGKRGWHCRAVTRSPNKSVQGLSKGVGHQHQLFDGRRPQHQLFDGRRPSSGPPGGGGASRPSLHAGRTATCLALP